MAMNMGRAFHPAMLVPMKVLSTSSGYYNDDNDYIEGSKTSRSIKGVMLKGNRFSQFDEGIARHSTKAGERFSDYRTLYVRSNMFGILTMDDHIVFRCLTYNVIQKGDMEHHGFTEYILERDLTQENKEVKF